MRFVRRILSWILLIVVVLVAASFGQIILFGLVTPSFVLSILFIALFGYVVGRVGPRGRGNS